MCEREWIECKLTEVAGLNYNMSRVTEEQFYLLIGYRFVFHEEEWVKWRILGSKLKVIFKWLL
jgi:hypothetical protein